MNRSNCCVHVHIVQLLFKCLGKASVEFSHCLSLLDFVVVGQQNLRRNTVACHCRFTAVNACWLDLLHRNLVSVK